MRGAKKIILFGLIVILFSCSSEKDKKQLVQLANLPISGSVTDVAEYVDDNGREYAIVGFGRFDLGSSPTSGIEIIDVTDPRNPVSVARETTVPGFDVKVWQNYVYTVDGDSDLKGSIIDISKLDNLRVVGEFQSSHNIFISKAGLMFCADNNLPTRILDLKPDPANPKFVWSGGFDGHDTAVIGNRWYHFGDSDATLVYDITNRTRPDQIVSIKSSKIALHHSGWPTEDGRHIYICDELADLSQPPKPFDITIWDISDAQNPKQVGGFADANATVHNLYIIGDYAYVSYYSAGFRIFDVSNPASPKLLETFATPKSDGGRFDGAFGVYPFAPSGNIYVSDSGTGLHIFSFEPGNLGGVNPVGS